MSGADVVFHPDAAEEFAEAFAWYSARSQAVGRRFEDEVERAVELIAESPRRWPVYDERHRKLLLRRFPYLIVYREFEGCLWIVAVAHGHRRPGYWRSREIGR